MRKAKILILITVLTIGICACGKGGNQQKSKENPVKEQTDSAQVKYNEYAKIVEQYGIAQKEQWDDEKLNKEIENDNVKGLIKNDALGYSLIDLNDDGVEELLILDIRYFPFSEMVEVYTMRDEKILKLCEISELLKDENGKFVIATVYMEDGHPGRLYYYNTFDGEELKMIEGIISIQDMDSDDYVFDHYYTMEKTTDETKAKKISDEEFEEIHTKYKSVDADEYQYKSVSKGYSEK